MRTLSRLFQTIFLTALLLPLAAPQLSAQSNLTFTRIVNNWPTIELYFKAACNGKPVYPAMKELYEIRDNGNIIQDFTIWCPDPRQRCSMSVSLVLDASISMAAHGEDLKNTCSWFVELMDGRIDESLVIWSNSSNTVVQEMTNDKDALMQAVLTLPSGGASAILDGIYAGLDELINNGNNPCRALLVFSDGKDNASTHTLDEIIAHANRNRIRVFTIGHGDVYAAPMETLALLTGGKFYFEPTPSQMVAVNEEISTIIFSGFLECLITYKRSCQDGAQHAVDLTLGSYCGGSDTKTRTYRAPKDTSMYEYAKLTLGATQCVRGGETSLPLRFTPPSVMGPALSFGPAAFTIRYPENILELDTVETLRGTLLHGMDVASTGNPGEMRVTIPERRYVDTSGTLLEFRFKVNHGAPLGNINVRIDSVEFEEGCIRPFTTQGTISVIPTDIPVILSHHGTQFCSGETMTLTCSYGLPPFLWNTGDTTRSIDAYITGIYTVEAENLLGVRRTSPPFFVEALMPVPPQLKQSAPGNCSGSTVRIWTAQRYDTCVWSTGATGQSILVDTPGVYYCDVQDDYGCWVRSDTITILEGEEPVPVISGPDDVCENGPEYSYAAQFHPSAIYSWDIHGGTILAGKDSISVSVRWDGSGDGMLRVLETDTRTGCQGRDTLDVSILDMSPVIHAPITQVCGGGSVTLRIAAGYDVYRWNTGDTTRSITVTSPGMYWCELEKDLCSGMSDTVSVTEIAPITAEISGKAAVCAHEVVTYTVPHYDTDYEWAVEGGTIMNGFGSSSVEIVWMDSAQGRITSIARVGGCTASDTLLINIAPATKPAFSVEGQLQFCEGDSAVFIADPGFVTYQWSNGATGQRTAIDSSGVYFLTTTDANGCSARSDQVSVVVHELPDTLVITQSDSTLSVKPQPMAGQYSWYLNGEKLPREHRILKITETGTYTAKFVSNMGCEVVSEPFVVTALAAHVPALARAFDISPNPNNGAFEVALEFAAPMSFSIRIVNTLGQTVYTESVGERRTSYRGSIVLDSPPGVYFFLLENEGRYDYKTVVVR